MWDLTQDKFLLQVNYEKKRKGGRSYGFKVIKENEIVKAVSY